jgi:hypothetical protein
MKTRFLVLGLVLSLIAACGPAGTSTPNGISASGGGKASIDLTVSGDLVGTSAQLAKYQCSGGQYGAFSDTFKPVVNGSEYDLQLLLGQYKGAPATYDFAAQPSNIRLDFYNDKAGWNNNDTTTGTITIDTGGESGTVDAHSLESGAGVFLTKVDLKFTFTCPVSQ